MRHPHTSSYSRDYFTSVPSDVANSNSMESATGLTQDGLSATFGFLVLVSSLILFLLSLHRSKSETRTSTAAHAVDPLTLDLPCRRCHYFKANRYLPCAVNPIQVLTLEAEHCTDFQAAHD